MAKRLKYEMFLDECCTSNRGIASRFIDGNGIESISWWSGPPEHIDHVDITYLQGRFGNVKTERHVAFIKKRFKEEMLKFKEYRENRFRPAEPDKLLERTR